MVEVIGVRFRTAGKIYFFNPKEFQVKSGDHVIVETARGIEFGSVVSERRQVKEKCIGDELKPVLRIATKEDEERAAKNREKEKEAYKICLDKIKEHELDMKLVSTEYTFDNNKVLFYFTADGRVDFRELVKDLAAVFRTRIELRQIGVRDEAKMLGGMGICGRKLSQGGRNTGDGQRSSCVFRSDSYNKCAAGDQRGCGQGRDLSKGLYGCRRPDHKCFRADTCYFLCRLCTIIFCGSGTPCHRTESFRLAWYSCTYGKMYTGSYV